MSSQLIAVKTEVVLDTIVGSIAAAVTDRLDDPIPPPAADDRLARMGYLARAIEIERFERAREPMPWLAEKLDIDVVWSEAAAALATELAAAEPADRRPEPDDADAVSWRVPGPGGHVRHYLAERAARDVGRQPGAGAKRIWLRGFLVHCIEEAAPPPSV